MKICTSSVSDLDVLSAIRTYFSQLGNASSCRPSAETQLIRNRQVTTLYATDEACLKLLIPQHRALRFIEEWGTDYLFDSTILSELIAFMNSQGFIVPYSLNERLGSPSATLSSSSVPIATRASFFPQRIPVQRNLQRKCISEFTDQDMRLLRQQLRGFEKRVRGAVEQKCVVKWLRQRRAGENPTLSIRENLLQVHSLRLYSVAHFADHLL